VHQSRPAPWRRANENQIVEIFEQPHRSIKLRLGPMLGLKRFRNAAITVAGVELMHRIRKGQFKLGTLCIKDGRAPEIWNAVLAA
jgi:transposase-like protein